MSSLRLVVSCAAGLATLSIAMPAQAAPTQASHLHVLLISIDGMHASDLTNYVAMHKTSALATLAGQGVVYPNALTSAPSDSFPGLLAQMTGGSSKSHGVFYDVSYDRALFAPGSQCKGTPGTQTIFDESIDVNSKAANGGGQLGKSLTQIDPTKLPMALRDGQCVPVYPHEFIKVNTIFEVIHNAGLRTAWADKHPAYDIVNGPSGTGVVDLFTPEVDSNDSITGQDTTLGFHSIQRNDTLKVTAVLNEIAGLDSTGKTFTGVPTIFGMNFQAVSVGQKLAVGNAADPQEANANLVGGYADAAGKHPNNGLQLNLDYVDQQIGAMLAAIKKAEIDKSTLVIISAKHGQSPINLALRKAVDDSPYQKTPGYSASITDDVGLVWLKPGAQKKDYAAAEHYLQSTAKTLGIVQLLDRDELAKLYQDPYSDNRTPDFVAVTEHGLIYTSGTKLAEHGGFANDDRNVALLVSNPSLKKQSILTSVETKQIAPTILEYLSLDPTRLQAVASEKTSTLPGISVNKGGLQ